MVIIKPFIIMPFAYIFRIPEIPIFLTHFLIILMIHTIPIFQALPIIPIFQTIPIFPTIPALPIIPKCRNYQEIGNIESVGIITESDLPELSKILLELSELPEFPDVYNTWSLSFDTWQKTQMSHVSNDSDHVIYLKI